ncbi:MAG TPA: VWA domain-containing protein, partial [Dissulfurispiraceae bacterium]
MIRKKHIALFFVLALLSLLSFPRLAPAAQPKAPAAADNGYDIMMLIDSSGSMRKTDPHDNRKAAAKLFITLMGESDRAGIVSFGDTAKVLSPLLYTSKANQGALFSAIDRISSKEFSTHIQDGVQKGYEAINPSQRSHRALILMSDGKLTLGSKEKEDAARAELSRLLPGLAQERIKLYSIAFTEMSDVNLLESMAKATGGFFKYAMTDKDIHVIFTSIFEKIKSPDSIPLEGNAFNVDKNIQEVILVISKQPGTSTAIVDPAGRKYTPARYHKSMKWYEAKFFSMITIQSPAVGRWQVNLSTQEGNKVFVITNLSLKSSFDRNFVNRGDGVKIDAWLEKDGGMVNEKDVLDQISFSAVVTGPDGKSVKNALLDDGKSGDGAAGDGKYAYELAADRLGEFSVKIAAEGKTFKREKTLQFKVVEPPAGQQAAPRSAAGKKAAAAA